MDLELVVDLFVLAVTTNPYIWVGLVFIFSLFVGSFLNVVIHRVPIMLEREWRSQAEQILSEQAARDGKTSSVGLQPDLQGDKHPQTRYNLVVPRSACPKCGAMITAAQNIPVI